MRSRQWRRVDWVSAALGAVLGCLGCAAGLPDRSVASSEATTAARGREPTSTSRAQREVRDLFERINRRRREIGCRALQWDERLVRVAMAHSQDMARRGFFSHDNPDGEDPFDRMRGAGIRFRAAAENLAMGQRSGRETFDAWMASPGHRRNLQDCVYTRVGIAVFRERWTCVLSRPPDAARGFERRADSSR
jgi:uncharacterized protein YkwD